MSKSVQAERTESPAHDFYRHALSLLQQASVPFLVGGAYAVARYTGIDRLTKDFDIFVMPADRDRVLAELAGAGYRTTVAFEHWLAKAFNDGHFIDVIYSSGNGLAEVDRHWFDHAVDEQVLGVQVQLVPIEEMIWSKAFIQERERYDGADVVHMLRAQAHNLNWDRLLERFRDDWRVLYAHLVLFGYVYPGDRARLPFRVMAELGARLYAELRTNDRRTRQCRGPVLSREQYLTDLNDWGYEDARVEPRGKMTQKDTDRWTAAIDKQK